MESIKAAEKIQGNDILYEISNSFKEIQSLEK